MAEDRLATRGLHTHEEILAEARRIHKVPDPYPLTLAGLIAALGPQAINFGISIGGGEAMLIPRVAALGGAQLFWIMTISCILETAVVYECIKYSLVTGRSFFTAVRDVPPKGLFWPWFWAIFSIITYFWPAWLGGGATALHRLTGFGTVYAWQAAGLLAVLIVFYLAPNIFGFISKFAIVIMWANILTILVVVALLATPEDILTVLWGYLNFGIAGLPQPLPDGQHVSFVEVSTLFGQPGGALMWVTLWVLEAGWGMGRYQGRVRGILRPPERINTEPLNWDYSDPEEVRKMKGWVSIGKWSLILWWSVIGAMLMTFLYGLAGHVYLYKNGIVKSGVEVPLQIAYIVGGTFGPVMFGVALIFVFATLYDAQFAVYDTYIGRTFSDAVAVTPGLREARPYRTYYFIVVTLSLLAGFYLVTVAQPYLLWLLSAFFQLAMRSIGAAQILYLNRTLPKTFQPIWITKALLWVAIVTGVLACSVWLYASLTGI